MSALGGLLIEEGREGEGVPFLEEALSRNPDELRTARALVGIHLKRQNLPAARALLLRIARADPKDAEAARLAERLVDLQQRTFRGRP